MSESLSFLGIIIGIVFVVIFLEFLLGKLIDSRTESPDAL